jgi:hypothetical protein
VRVQDDGDVVLSSDSNPLIWHTNTAHGTGLNARESLKPDSRIRSLNGRFELIFGRDGNLIIIDKREGNRTIFETKNRANNSLATLKIDGNFGVFEGETAKWETKSAGHQNAVLRVQDTGSAVITANGEEVWTSDHNVNLL